MINRCCLRMTGVVPEYQCAVKREAKKAQKEKDRPNSSSLGSPDMKEPEVKVIHQLHVILDCIDRISYFSCDLTLSLCTAAAHRREAGHCLNQQRRQTTQS